MPVPEEEPSEPQTHTSLWIVHSTAAQKLPGFPSPGFVVAGHTCPAFSLELTIDLRPEHLGAILRLPVLGVASVLLPVFMTCLVTVRSMALGRET